MIPLHAEIGFLVHCEPGGNVPLSVLVAGILRRVDLSSPYCTQQNEVVSVMRRLLGLKKGLAYPLSNVTYKC